MRKLKKHLAVMLSIAMVFSVMPQLTMAEGTQVLSEQENGEGHEGSEEESGDEEDIPVDYEQEVIDEAKALGVPDAFIKHSFAADFEDGKLEEPTFQLGEGESPKYKMNTVVSAAGVRGLEIKGIDTGLLARAKFDLGTFDFGEMKLGYLIYNILAKKNMKGKAYLYLDEETEPFATLNIKRSADSDWEEIRNKAVDVRDKEVQGLHQVYLKYVANSALDDEGNIIKSSGVKGSLFLESMFFTEGSTPVLNFDLDEEVNTVDRINGSEDHSIMGYGDMNVQIPEGYECEYTDKPLESATYELDYIRGRGNSTWLTSKKPYKIKLDKSADLFGMGSSKHWVLLANYYDYSLVRNKMTFELAKRMDLEYTPKSVFVDVVIAGEYCGSYQLTQHVRIGKNNVAIDDLEDKPASTLPNITGGYLLAMDESWLKGDEGKPNIHVGNNLFLIDKPEYDADYSEEAKQAQVDYITNYLHELNYIIEGEDEYFDEEADGIDEELAGKDWRDYMDEQSYIDYYLIQEISKNGDAYGGSTYLYKERNGLLYWGPVWDFDFVAWGAPETDYLANGGVEGFQCIYGNPWFETLLEKDPEVKEKVVERWQVMSEILKDIASDGGFIDQCKNQLYYSALANYQVRGSYLMGDINYWGDEPVVNRDENGELYHLNYFNEVDRLKRTVNASVEWMDENVSTIGEGNYGKYPEIPFTVDGEIVAYVHYDAWNECIEMSEIPEAPEKEGMVFKGWFYEDEDGVEHKLNEEVWPFYYNSSEESEVTEEPETIKKTEEETEEELVPYTFYAKYVSEDSIIPITAITSFADTYYVPMEEWYMDTEEEPYYESETLYLNQLISVLPMDADIEDVKYSLEEESKDIHLSEDGEVYLRKPGEYIVNCIAGDVVKQITIIGVSEQEIENDEDYSIVDSLNLKQGSYGNLGFRFTNEMVSFSQYQRVLFKSLDPEIVEVSRNGVVYGKSVGKAKIVVVQSYGSNVDVQVVDVVVESGESSEEPTTETTTSSQEKTTEASKVKKPKKVVIKKGYKKKKAAKKIRLKLSKVEGADGYQVCIYQSKKQAKKNKSALVKKYVDSVKVSVKSKKVEGLKKLFVRARAYRKNGKSRVFGDWSDIKRIKIK
ncbi:MAG: CotH kinase family protein [Eubacterium sp.]|nr:CotH kinase family protein [Eubacterium sp.]